MTLSIKVLCLQLHHFMLICIYCSDDWNVLSCTGDQDPDLDTSEKSLGGGQGQDLESQGQGLENAPGLLHIGSLITKYPSFFSRDIFI